MNHNADRQSRAFIGALITALTAVVLWLFLSTTGAVGAKKKEFAADKGPDTIDVSSYPKKYQKYYRVFASKCSRCHTLARAINTTMSNGAWKRYVKRMMNKPDSGISPSRAKRIYRFLKYRNKLRKRAASKKK